MKCRLQYIVGCLIAFSALLIQVSNAQVPQAVRTYFLDFRPIPVGESRTQDLIIDEMMNQGGFKVQKPLQDPFQVLSTPNDLTVRNGQILVRVSFSPSTKGAFIGDLFLVRDPTIPQNNDTIRVRVTGTSFFIARNEVLDFGRVFTGLARRDSVPVRSEPNSQSEWIVAPPGKPKPPFYLESLIPKNNTSMDTAFFVFRFAPAEEGVFRDTLRLIRKRQNVMFDTIVVYLVGRGIDLDTVINASFGAVLTGDSVARRRTFIQPRPHLYEIEYKPSQGSGYTIYKQSDIQSDSVEAVIAFTPTQERQYRDSLILVRKSQTGSVFDRIIIHLDGKGVGMQHEARLDFVGVQVDDNAKDSIDIRLDAKPLNAEFVYKLNKQLSGYVRGEVRNQDANEDEILITFTSSPDVFRNTTETFILYRTDVGGTIVDSSVISVVTSMSARPVRLSLSLQADTVRMRIGESSTLNVVLHVQGDMDQPLEVNSIKGRMSYNPTVVVPQLTNNIQRVVDGDRIYIEYTSGLTTPVVISGQSTVIAQIKVMAVIGDTDRTVLDLQDWVIGSSDTKFEVQEITDGFVLITNPWRYENGNGRFVNSLQGALKLDIIPNPIITTSTLSVGNVEVGTGELLIVDVNGAVVADLTQQLGSGIREFPLYKGSGAGILLNPGSYYARLFVRNGTSSINSVVRLFIVQ